jgi:uncharacterized membrane protein
MMDTGSPAAKPRRSPARYVAEAGVIAATYAGFTILTIEFLQGLAWGPVQLRVSEAVTVVALFTPAAVPGLWLGAVIANMFGAAATGNPLGWLDVVFGSLATLLGAWWTWRYRANRPLALAGPVVANALIVPAYLPILLAGFGFYKIPLLGWDLSGAWPWMYLFGVVTVGAGQAIVVYGLGWPLANALSRRGLASKW